jgi:predicted small lipoprotein YifL
MQIVLKTFLLVALLVATTACGTTRRGPVPEGERTTVEVRNQNFLDMNVFVLSGSQRIRLGTVTGLSTRTLTIPSSLVFGSATVRFQMNPIGSNARPVSQEITVSQGGQIVLTIPYW